MNEMIQLGPIIGVSGTWICDHPFHQS